ncbi:MAG: threonine--tRNA ligase, partial [Endomicrobiia bacterium]
MDNKLETLRHSASHIMAEAVVSLFPETKVAIGPSIEEGFYYDFDRKESFTVDDLSKIEEKMKEIIKENASFVCSTVSKTEAIKLFEEKGEKYKVELANVIEGDTVTFYQSGKFIDLCKGPHVKSTGEVKYFKLLSVA